MKLTKIYTRGGDAGETSLGSGERVRKHSLRVAAYGTTDEANSVIGIARIHTKDAVNAMLKRIQNDLFDLGADLCIPEGSIRHRSALRITDTQVDRLEMEIDELNAGLEPLNSFVLPGGTPAAAHLHLARCVVRRAERLITELAESEEVTPATIRYINRLSDYLFVVARVCNNSGESDVLWQPGINS